MGTPPPSPLGEGDNVRLDAVFLVTKEAAKASETGLNFIEDEEEALFVAPLAYPLQVIVGGDVDAAFALNGFQHDGGGAFRGGGHDGFHVVVVHMYVAGGKGLEGFLVVGLAGGCDGGEGTPVEGVEGGDNLVGAVAVLLAVFAGKLEGAFDGLCAAIAKEDSIKAAVVDEGLGQI